MVDITNYVMLEWGQPLHAFDFDKLGERCRRQNPCHNRATRSRRRSDDDAPTTWRRDLTPDNLLIADTAGQSPSPGHGGAGRKFSAGTTQHPSRSANFDFVSIPPHNARTQSVELGQQQIQQGDSIRNGPSRCERAANSCGNTEAQPFARVLVDNYPSPRPAQVVI